MTSTLPAHAGARGPLPDAKHDTPHEAPRRTSISLRCLPGVSLSAGQPQRVLRATKAVVCTPTQVNPPSVTPPWSVVSATFADVVSLLAMLLVQLSQVFGVHDVRSDCFGEFVEAI